MMRVYIANANANERSALTLLVHNLHMEVVGEASDWLTTITKAPATKFKLLLLDWNVLPPNASVRIAELRQACTDAIIVVLTSYFDAGQQAARAAGADVFISKTEMPNRLAHRLQTVAKTGEHKFHIRSKQGVLHE